MPAVYVLRAGRQRRWRRVLVLGKAGARKKERREQRPNGAGGRGRKGKLAELQDRVDRGLQTTKRPVQSRCRKAETHVGGERLGRAGLVRWRVRYACAAALYVPGVRGRNCKAGRSMMMAGCCWAESNCKCRQAGNVVDGSKRDEMNRANEGRVRRERGGACRYGCTMYVRR